VRIVLCEPSHPGNVGATARAMKTMGLTRLALVRPRRFPDPEAQARAAGAVDVLDAAQVCDTLEEALGDARLAIAVSARPRELAAAVRGVREAAGEALGTDAHGDAAFVFGNETSGLSNDQVARCQMLAHIPAAPAFASLNLASAVQVVAYELRMAALAQDARRDVEAPARRLAPLSDVEHLYAHAARAALPRPAAAAAPDAAASTPVRAHAPGARGGRHPARHPRGRGQAGRKVASLGCAQPISRTRKSERGGKKTSSVTRTASAHRNGTTPRKVSIMGTSRAMLLMM
jgi:tRNA/rRNA methyltransferase